MISSKINIYCKGNIIISDENKDIVSLIDIVKFKNQKKSKDIIKNRITSKYFIEFLCLWKKINNNHFKLFKLDFFKKFNALFIKENISESERLIKLNNMSILQMKVLLENRKTLEKI